MSNFLCRMETVLCLFFLACLLEGGAVLFLTNQNAYEVHRGSGAGLSSTNFLVWLKWEEVEALAFRVGCVAVV